MKIPRRELVIKDGQPGAQVSWSEDGATRAGVVWSGAPGPRCVWVTPDESRPGESAVLIQLQRANPQVGSMLAGGDWRDRMERGRLTSSAGYVTYRRQGYFIVLHLPTCPEIADEAVWNTCCRIAGSKVTGWAFDPGRRYLPEVVKGMATRWCPTCLLGPTLDEE